MQLKRWLSQERFHTDADSRAAVGTGTSSNLAWTQNYNQIREDNVTALSTDEEARALCDAEDSKQ